MRLEVLFLLTFWNILANNNQIRVPKSYNLTTYKSCFEHLGCIDTNQSWFHQKLRPVNLEPLDRLTVKTTFLLIKPSRDQGDLVYDVVTAKQGVLAAAGFKKENSIMFLIHDFTSNGYTGWVKHLTNALPSGSSWNIISVDWQSGAEPPFNQAIANARLVALEIVFFIGSLKGKSGVSISDIYLIGHGVGAHIAGYVGKCVSGIRKITALDPTGPSFAGMPKFVRLDVNDAEYVEVLHTDAFDAKSQGTKQNLGHADFYINNANLQPNCNHSTSYPVFTKLDRNSLKQGIILPDCSHKRSFKYFIESIENKDCEFIGIQCDNYEHFLEGKCASCQKQTNKTTCATFGLQSSCTETKNNMFYLNTRGEAPFCLHPYRVNITMGSEFKKQSGKFSMIWIGNSNQVVNASCSTDQLEKKEYAPKSTYTLLFYASSPKLSTIKQAKVKWISNSKCIAFCSKSVKVEEIVIIPLSVSGKSYFHENRLCPQEYPGEIASNSYVTFLHCCNSTTGTSTSKKLN